MGRGHVGHFGVGFKFKGTQAQRMPKFQKILVIKSSFSKGHILWNLCWIASRRNCFNKYSTFWLCVVFPNITSSLRILSVCLHQWIQVNTLSMCWNVLRIITVQPWARIVWIVWPGSVSAVTCTKAIFFLIMYAFLDFKKVRKASVK
jgi:hypothetical protein